MICENILPLSEVADATENGKHYPLMLITLQNINKNLGKNALIDLFGKSKVSDDLDISMCSSYLVLMIERNRQINLLHTLPEADRTKERLAEILEDRNLTFLFPLLRIQADLWKQIKTDGDPNSLYKWIKENLDPAHFSDPGFISALATVVVKYITQVCMRGVVSTGIIEQGITFLAFFRRPHSRKTPILRAFQTKYWLKKRNRC